MAGTESPSEISMILRALPSRSFHMLSIDFSIEACIPYTRDHGKLTHASLKPTRQRAIRLRRKRSTTQY
jgi:hypothetical protein